MINQNQDNKVRQINEEVSRIMHLHYVDNNIEEVIKTFSDEFSWFGAGEDQYALNYKEAVDFFRRFRNEIPKCNISQEEYDTKEIAPDIFVCSGRLWIETAADARMYVKVHQRVTFVFQWTEERLLCKHIHCSNPYMDLIGDELFPNEIGKQSYEYVQEQLNRLENEMNQKNKQLAVIMSSIPGGLKISWDDDTYSFKYVSEEAAALFGYTVDEFVEMSGGSAIGAAYPPDLPQALSACQEAFKDGNTEYVIKYRVRCKDGSLKWILDSGSKTIDENGNTLINSLYLDITENELLQEQMMREQEMYRLAMESSSDAMYEYTLDNDTMVSYELKVDNNGKNTIEKKEFLNYKKLVLDGILIYPEDIQVVIDNICNGKAQDFEARLCLKNEQGPKRYQWHRVTGKKIAISEENYRIVGTLRNIHEEKETLSANLKVLHRNQAALQAISGVYASIYYVDLNEDKYYSVRLHNLNNNSELHDEGKFTLDLTKYILKDVISDDHDKMCKFLQPQTLCRILRKVNDSEEMEYCINVCGEKKWLRIEIRLVSIEDGRACDIIMAFRNVTEERKKELEHIQEEELSKKTLEEAFKAASQASSAKSDFLSRMSHDIRTPMNAVMGMLTIAESNTGNSEKIERCLKKIRMSSEHLLNIINEVLDMSKIENGNAGLNEVEFNIIESLKCTTEMIRQECNEKGQKLELNIGHILHEEVEGDVVKVQQILLNLLTNAMKYTPQGGNIQIRVQEILPAVREQSCYQIAVEDTGIGMTDEFIEKLFQPFERANDNRVTNIQGTGLGMSITQNFVRLMNGTIEVESTFNEGSCFTVTICLKIADTQKRENQVKNSKKDNNFKINECNILLVEDNDLNRDIAKELLEMKNLNVDVAVNGKDAVEKFMSSSYGYYQFIFMDIQMPVMNGYDAARAIRAMSRPDSQNVKIIALTANAFSDDIYRAKQAGMDAHLAKPLDMRQILQILEE